MTPSAGPKAPPQAHAGDGPPRGLPDGTVIGPWTLRSRVTLAGARSWVTVACSRCAAVPCDEALGMYASFASIDQARLELPRDWGWLVTALPGRADQVLCPRCAPPPARH
jgi:hypothetical protein